MTYFKKDLDDKNKENATSEDPKVQILITYIL